MSTESSEIAYKLFKYLEKNPHIRFGQALLILDLLKLDDDMNVKDPFYTSDEETLKRLKENFDMNHIKDI